MTYSTLSCGLEVANDSRIEEPDVFAACFANAFERFPAKERALLSRAWRNSGGLRYCSFFHAAPEYMSKQESGAPDFNIALMNRLPTDHLETLFACAIIECLQHFSWRVFNTLEEQRVALDAQAEALGFDVAALDSFVAENAELLA